MRNVKLFSLVQNFCLRLIMEKQAQEKEDVRIDTSSQKDQKSFSRSLIKQKVWYIRVIQILRYLTLDWHLSVFSPRCYDAGNSGPGPQSSL